MRHPSALKSPQPAMFFSVERHWAASKLSLPKRMIASDYLRSFYDQMVQMAQMAQSPENMSNLTANIPMIGDSCGLLKCFSLRLVDWRCCAWEFNLYGNFSHVQSKMGHPCTCSVVTLAAATHQPRGTERRARALGFSPLPNASNENNKQKVLRVAAEMHYNYRTSTLIHHIYIHQY